MPLGLKYLFIFVKNIFLNHYLRVDPPYLDYETDYVT